MTIHQEEMVTFSVRQLALMFGKSEQTVRRWKDEGKLQDGLSNDKKKEHSGALVFSLSAVQDFIQHNPRVMNHAKPEFIQEFLGPDGMKLLRHRKSFFRFTTDAPAVYSADGTTGQGKSRYVLNLISSREEQLTGRLGELSKELEHVQEEKTLCKESDYLLAVSYTHLTLPTMAVV